MTHAILGGLYGAQMSKSLGNYGLASRTAPQKCSENDVHAPMSLMWAYY